MDDGDICDCAACRVDYGDWDSLPGVEDYRSVSGVPTTLDPRADDWHVPYVRVLLAVVMAFAVGLGDGLTFVLSGIVLVLTF